MKSIKIFFFGDSICFGQGVSLHKGWVARISAELGRFGEELGVECTVVNASINGNTTRMALERMPYDIQSNQPDIIICQFGMNDCNYWQTDRGVPRVSPKAFAANLEEIITRGFTFGASAIFLNTNHTSARNDQCFPYTKITYEESNRSYNEQVRKVAAAYDERVKLTDMEAIFLRETEAGVKLPSLLLPDKLHISIAGHDLYFSAIYPKLKQVVATLSRKKKSA